MTGMRILGLSYSKFLEGVDLTDICLTGLTSCLAELIGLICYFCSVDRAITISRVSYGLHLYSSVIKLLTIILVDTLLTVLGKAFM
jgi:hypothetical protein